MLFSCERRFLELAEDEDDFSISTNTSNERKEARPNENRSRALGFKPYSTKTGRSFGNLEPRAFHLRANCFIRDEVPVKKSFPRNLRIALLHGTIRFVIFRKSTNRPLIVFELDGPEHEEDEAVKARDRKKKEFLDACGLRLVRVKNSYARRYNYIKDILADFFGSAN